MQQLITDNNQVVLLAGPEKEGVKYPTKEEIAALLKQMKSFDLKPYEDKVSNEPLISSFGNMLVPPKLTPFITIWSALKSVGFTYTVTPLESTNFKMRMPTR